MAGGVAEWSIAAVLKTAKAKHLRGFESLPLRQIFNVKNYILTFIAAAFVGAVAVVNAQVVTNTNTATAAANTAAVTNAAAATNTAAQAARRTSAGDNEWISYAIWGAVILAIFGFLWAKGYLVKMRNYVEETREELRKCSWPTREELKGSTVVVIITTALLGLFTVGVDWILSNVLRLIT